MIAIEAGFLLSEELFATISLRVVAREDRRRVVRDIMGCISAMMNCRLRTMWLVQLSNQTPTRFSPKINETIIRCSKIFDHVTSGNLWPLISMTTKRNLLVFLCLYCWLTVFQCLCHAKPWWHFEILITSVVWYQQRKNTNVGGIRQYEHECMFYLLDILKSSNVPCNKTIPVNYWHSRL